MENVNGLTTEQAEEKIHLAMRTAGITDVRFSVVRFEAINAHTQLASGILPDEKLTIHFRNDMYATLDEILDVIRESKSQSDIEAKCRERGLIHPLNSQRARQ